ncbi:hypothetical protein [Sphingomonas sp. CV7422]|uniref:hypothetical protein n=1 Tax=Sphingomonas sp. CV7422 TaxID=3018036 RepID=UPI0022FE9F40|nr:hypothetical protein [Sphingomonas sp. CV7422]
MPVIANVAQVLIALGKQPAPQFPISSGTRDTVPVASGYHQQNSVIPSKDQTARATQSRPLLDLYQEGRSGGHHSVKFF